MTRARWFAAALATALAALAWRSLRGDWPDLDLTWDEPSCRVCGCTDDHACPGGCWWVTDPLGLGDLCSACVPTGVVAIAS